VFCEKIKWIDAPVLICDRTYFLTADDMDNIVDIVCQLRVCETANMTTLYKRETQASIFLCILCIRTYNKANMTNKHRSTTKHVRSRQARLTDSLAYTRATAAATKNRPSTRLLLKRDITSIPQKMHRTSLLINDDSAS